MQAELSPDWSIFSRNFSLLLSICGLFWFYALMASALLQSLFAEAHLDKFVISTQDTAFSPGTQDSFLREQ